MTEEIPSSAEVPTEEVAMTFELVNVDRSPLLDKVQRLKEAAAFRGLECTGVMHPATNSATVTFKPKPLAPFNRRVAMVLKSALRTHGLRAVATKE